MTVNTASSMAEIKLDMMELKLDRLIDEMRFLKSRTSHSIRACVGSRHISNRTNRANNREGLRPPSAWSASVTPQPRLLERGFSLQPKSLQASKRS
jgi:hypothetical protein